MNKFCFTQSESNKSYCKTQSSIIYIPLPILFLIVSIASVNSYSLGTVLSNCNLYQRSNKHLTFAFMSMSGSTLKREDFANFSSE